jgi:hypothetical protein
MRPAFRWALVNPWATLTLAVAVTAVALAIPAPTIDVRQPTNGFRTIRLGAVRITQHVNGTLDYYVLKDNGLLRLTNPNEESWDEVSRRLAGDAANVLHLRYVGVRSRAGMWAPTRETEEERIELAYGSGFSAEERVKARAMLIDQVLAPQWHPGRAADELRRLRAGDVHISRTLWSGHALNAAQAVLLVGLVYSGQWVRNVPVWIRGKRRTNALARGRCPRCGYSITGLPRCPECGEDLTAPPAPVAGGPR